VFGYAAFPCPDAAVGRRGEPFVAEKGHWITKNGNPVFIPDGGGGGGKGKGKGVVVAIGAAVVIAGGAGGAAGIGAFGGAAGEAGAGAASEAFAGNMAGDVVDSLPGRSLKTRRAEGRESAKRGKTDEAFSRLKFKRLKPKCGSWSARPAVSPPRPERCGSSWSRRHARGWTGCCSPSGTATATPR
jgi:hypothetical protein